MKLIENKMPMIIALCKKHKVNNLFVFGSILTDKFNSESDIQIILDLIKNDTINFKPIKSISYDQR